MPPIPPHPVGSLRHKVIHVPEAALYFIHPVSHPTTHNKAFFLGPPPEVALHKTSPILCLYKKGCKRCLPIFLRVRRSSITKRTDCTTSSFLRVPPPFFLAVHFNDSPSHRPSFWRAFSSSTEWRISFLNFRNPVENGENQKALSGNDIFLCQVRNSELFFFFSRGGQSALA